MSIGQNNIIADDVIIHPQVIIGNNNIIKRGTEIYPQTVIGNNNVFMEGNIIGVYPVEANKKYEELDYGGLIIGHHNIFHVRNIISTGCYQKTIIGDYNKFLSDVYISHDNIIHNNVTFYPRVFSAGLVTYFDNANIGAGACIHQKILIGAYSMIGMNNSIVKNVMPYMICINGRYTRLNSIKLDKDTISALNQVETLLVEDKSFQSVLKTLPLTIQNKFYQILSNHCTTSK